MIEAVQRRATKLMVGNKLSYKDRLRRTNLMSLSSRRIYLDLLFLSKCLHDLYYLYISNYLKLYDFEHESYYLRNTELTIKIPYARTNTLKFSFFPRVARLWNSLLLSLRKIKLISNFKKELRAYYIDMDCQA